MRPGVIHTYIHASMHPCIHASMHPCIHACMHAYMHTCIHAYMHTCIHASMHACIHAYMHTCIHAYMHTCIHACMHTYIHTYIYMQVRFHRNLATSSLAADCNVPQRPPAIIRSFTSIQMIHTHTQPAAAGWMKCKWKWDGNDHEMTNYLTGTRDGERKRGRERKNTNTNTPSPERANLERARGKKKRTDDGPTTDQRRRGRTEAPDATYKARAKPTSAREGPKADLTREHTWNRGPMGNKLMKNDASTNLCMIRDKATGPRSSSHNPLDGLSVHQPFELVHNWTSPETMKRKKDHI